MDILLSPVEARVLACLLEKSVTTPEYYPLTLNALVAACNQKSNRDPVMSLDEATISASLQELRYRDHLIWEVSQSGSRSAKFKHDLDTRLQLDPLGQAILCELMLRGPQTLGELRSRTERFCGAKSAEEIEAAINGLINREAGPLAVKLPPGSGKREARFAHLLCGAPDTGGESAPAAVDSLPPSPMQQQLSSLTERVTVLESQLQEMQARFEAFRTQFE